MTAQETPSCFALPRSYCEMWNPAYDKPLQGNPAHQNHEATNAGCQGPEPFILEAKNMRRRPKARPQGCSRLLRVGVALKEAQDKRSVWVNQDVRKQEANIDNSIKVPAYLQAPFEHYAHPSCSMSNEIRNKARERNGTGQERKHCLSCQRTRTNKTDRRERYKMPNAQVFKCSYTPWAAMRPFHTHLHIQRLHVLEEQENHSNKGCS
mmetsp:Transcript_56319/g.143353  ORF Transcript_56319/g.143353 Transcript_56319/m.143353 type:complete len:208 (+) Transcript_56319:844-1467(+)